MTSIRIDDVSKRFKGALVLDGITMALDSGRVTGLAGANGSGKTMLMRVMLGLVRPTAGTVSYDGRALGHDIDFPPSVGFLIEAPAFLGGYSGLDNLLMIASIRDVIGREQVASAIERVGLDPSSRLPFRKYSLGMKQRLGIACAVMEQPDVVILDEPTNALDEGGVRMFEHLVAGECERGAVVVLACHDGEVLRRLADEIWYLSEGHLERHEVCGVGEFREALIP